MSVKDDVMALLATPIAQAGYELIEVTYQKSYGSMALTLYIDTDKAGGISLDDCEAVSNLVDSLLDEADPTNSAPYTLNVSSPGLDRPIKTPRDFAKKQGTKVEATLYAPQNGQKKIEGLLDSWNEETITLISGAKQLILQRKDIAVLKPVIEF